jgi:tripartite-type tricarboxylate transporter receptor subunit TctC
MLGRMTRVCAALMFAALLFQPQARAQDYPNKPITIVVLLAAGTGMDVIVRLYAEQLSQALGKPVLVDNRPGTQGLVGIQAVKGAPADGYTLLAATSSTMAIRPSLFKQTPYDVQKDFVPISLYVKSPFILVVNPSLPIRSVPELVKFFKDNPGKHSYSSSSTGGAPHLATEFMKQKFGLDIAHVPYRNSPQSIADVAAGHVSLAFAEAGVSVPLIKDGKLRALAVSSATRLATLPEVPPFAEAAAAGDFEAVSWHVLMAPEGTPRPVIDRIHAEMKRIMNAPEMKQKTGAMGLIPVDTGPIEDARAYIKAEGEKWGGLVTQLGLAGSQ